MSSDFRAQSRLNWTPRGDAPTTEQIAVGCLQRIADATEAMAKEYNRLIREKQYLERAYRSRGAEVERLTKQRSALRGTITRMKNKAKAQAQEAPNEQ